MIEVGMVYERFAKLAQSICQNLVAGKYAEVADEFGYALAFDLPKAAALKRDFELAIGANTAKPGEDSCEIVISKFLQDTAGFDYLIECRLTLSGSDECILVEIVSNKSGLYLEDISRISSS